MPVQTSSIVLIALVPLIIWRLYRRFKKLVGRQRSKAWRHWAGAILFPFLILMLALPILRDTTALGSLAAGVAAGIALAIVGFQRTQLEATPQGYFYTPHAHIGIALTLLMVARIGYRIFEMASFTQAERATHMQQFARSPLTLAIIGVIAAYYATYAIALIRWRSRTMLPSTPAGEQP